MSPNDPMERPERSERRELSDFDPAVVSFLETLEGNVRDILGSFHHKGTDAEVSEALVETEKMLEALETSVNNADERVRKETARMLKSKSDEEISATVLSEVFENFAHFKRSVMDKVSGVAKEKG